MSDITRILIVEDLPSDVDLIEREVRRVLPAGEFLRVETREDFLAALRSFRPDVILSDYKLPRFDGMSALKLALEHAPETPFLLVTNSMNEDTAVACMKAGAWDYIVKNRIKQLGPAVLGGLERKRLRRDQRIAKEKSRRWERVFEEAQFGIAYIDAATDTFIEVNATFARERGYAPEELNGQPTLDICPPEERDAMRRRFREIDERGHAVFESVCLRKDGSRFPVLMEVTSIRDDQGRPVSRVGYALDITDRRKLEEQVRQARMIESIGTLAGGVAHDFNNILTAIVGYAHVTLMNMAQDDPQRSNIESILEAADRAARLTKDLLLFSRKRVGERKPVDLNEVVGKVDKFLKKVIGEDIECRTVLHGAPIPVQADSQQMEQVLMNLAMNARDAMPHGGVFTIRTEPVLPAETFTAAHGHVRPGAYAMITVSDTGKGMDEETRKRIFEPFFTTRDVGKGTGLGLAVVYGIIRQHDGFIDVQSKPGAGTTFRIYLPVLAMGTKREDVSHGEPPVRGTETILLAEDEASVRSLFTTILTRFGYTVIEAVDGEDAVRKFLENQDKVQLLLLDLIMPRRNGKEAHDEIVKRKPGVKTIFASGYSPDLALEKTAFENGVSLIYKPISPVDLLKKVRSVLDGGTDG
ncbi:MAG: response regulator [bacterium]|jgi:PAS domain S-box-containing protein